MAELFRLRFLSVFSFLPEPTVRKELAVLWLLDIVFTLRCFGRIGVTLVLLRDNLDLYV